MLFFLTREDVFSEGVWNDREKGGGRGMVLRYMMRWLGGGMSSGEE